MKSSKVILISLFSKGGGAERVLTHLANYFCEKGFKTNYVFFKNNGFYKLNEKVELLDLGKGTIGSMLRLRRFLKKNKGSTIIAFGYPAAIKTQMALIGIKRRFNVICSERNDPSRNVTGFAKKLLRNWAYARSDKIVFQTEDAKHFFPGTIQNKGTIILNPMPRNETMSEHKFNGRIVALGRIDPQKNFSLLLEAFARIRKVFEKCELHVFGEFVSEPEKEKLESIIRNRDIFDCCFLRGFTTKTQEELLNSEIYVSTSNYEGISNSMLEAMSLGLPVVCTDCPCGGTRMIIKNGENGLIVPCNDVNALVAALESLISNRQLEEKLGFAAKKISDELSMEKIGALWMALMEN